MSVGDALESIRFADVVIVLMDNAQAFDEQDLRLVDFAEREGRAIVIGFNKWDLEEGGQGMITKLRDETDRMLPQVRGVPVIALSGLTGFGLDRLMDSVIEAHHVWNKRVTTNALNRWFEDAINANPPPAVSGPPPQAQLHDAGQGAPAELRRVLHPRRRGAGQLYTLPGQWIARSLRHARHADPPDAARKEESVRA